MTNQKSFIFDTELRLVVPIGVKARSLQELRAELPKVPSAACASITRMEHPTPIHPRDLAVYSPDKMGKSTIFRAERVMVGLNAFEPGQEHALHAHAGTDKIYRVMVENRFQELKRLVPFN